VWLQRRQERTAKSGKPDLVNTSSLAFRSPHSAFRLPMSPPGVEPGLRPSQSRVPPSHPKDIKYPTEESNLARLLRRQPCVLHTRRASAAESGKLKARCDVASSSALRFQVSALPARA